MESAVSTVIEFLKQYWPLIAVAVGLAGVAYGLTRKGSGPTSLNS
ncbi:MAG: hypothetical protein AAB638_04175 [Patescibacteria group bacterium]